MPRFLSHGSVDRRGHIHSCGCRVLLSVVPPCSIGVGHRVWTNTTHVNGIPTTTTTLSEGAHTVRARSSAVTDKAALDSDTELSFTVKTWRGEDSRISGGHHQRFQFLDAPVRCSFPAEGRFWQTLAKPTLVRIGVSVFGPTSVTPSLARVCGFLCSGHLVSPNS